MAARAFAARHGGEDSNGPPADEAAQRLLPSGGGGGGGGGGDGIELTPSDGNPSRGGAVRRRARLLEQLESMDLEQHVVISKQKLVGVAAAKAILRAHRQAMRMCFCKLCIAGERIFTTSARATGIAHLAASDDIVMRSGHAQAGNHVPGKLPLMLAS